MNWLIENKEWIFSGIGVTIVVGILGFVFKRKSKSESNIGSNNTNTNNATNTINNFVNITPQSDNEKSNEKSKRIDKTIQILFVDDEKFDIIGVLKDAGWINTKRIKDITNLDSTDLKNAEVVFVDVNGVGKQLFPKDQGLGLAEAIKHKYPNKHIVLYSAVSHHFHKALNVVDIILEKNADPYEFINILENYVSHENANQG